MEEVNQQLIQEQVARDLRAELQTTGELQRFEDSLKVLNADGSDIVADVVAKVFEYALEKNKFALVPRDQVESFRTLKMSLHRVLRETARPLPGGQGQIMSAPLMTSDNG